MLVLLWLTIPLTLWGQQIGYQVAVKITGRVTATPNFPISDAEVSLTPKGADTTLAVTRSDNDGRFVLSADPLHEYTIRLYCPGFAYKTGTLTTGTASSHIELGDIVLRLGIGHGDYIDDIGSPMPTQLSRQPGLSDLLTDHVKQDLAGPATQACLEGNGLRLEEGLRITWLQLTQNGDDAVLAEGQRPCFTTSGNRPMALYWQDSAGWQLILLAEGRRIEPLSTKTGTWYDIAVHQHDSAHHTTRILYQYQGDKYVARECKQTVTSRWDDGQPMIETTRPCSAGWQNRRLGRSN
jgi:carboxypeptidase family protein